MTKQLVDFQSRVAVWMVACFGTEAPKDRVERRFRFLEEALELFQATGGTEEQAQELLRYIYNRPPGAMAQEMGGVLLTLASLCSAYHIDMDNMGELELARVWDNIDKIRRKQAEKPAMVGTGKEALP